jgi:hypothetical protein
MKKVLYVIAGCGAVLVFGATALAGTNAYKVTIPGSAGYTVIKAKEFINSNLMTYKKTSKAKLIDHYCDRRVDELSYAQSVSRSVAFDTSLNRYEDQKTKALNLAKQAEDESVINKINQNTLKQEKQMTALQLMEQDLARKERIVDVQKTVANESRSATTVVSGEVQGVKIEKEINNVWYAEGTGPGDGGSGEAPAGWTYEAGTGPNKVEGGTTGEGSTTYSGGTEQSRGRNNRRRLNTYSGGTGENKVEGGTTGEGGQKVEGNPSNLAPGTEGQDQGTGGQKVVN